MQRVHNKHSRCDVRIQLQRSTAPQMGDSLTQDDVLQGEAQGVSEQLPETWVT